MNEIRIGDKFKANNGDSILEIEDIWVQYNDIVSYVNISFKVNANDRRITCQYETAIKCIELLHWIRI